MSPERLRQRGKELRPEEIPGFLRQVTRDVAAAWQEAARADIPPLEKYWQVARSVGELAPNVNAVAFEWVRGTNDEEQRVGETVLMPQALKSILNSIARIERDFPNNTIDGVTLVEYGVTYARERMKNPPRLAKDFFPYVNTATYEFGVKLVIEEYHRIGTDIDVQNLLVPHIDAFIQKHKKQPSLKQKAIMVMNDPAFRVFLIKPPPASWKFSDSPGNA
jgi:hypothetical protein